MSVATRCKAGTSTVLSGENEPNKNKSYASIVFTFQVDAGGKVAAVAAAAAEEEEESDVKQLGSKH